MLNSIQFIATYLLPPPRRRPFIPKKQSSTDIRWSLEAKAKFEFFPQKKSFFRKSTAAECGREGGREALVLEAHSPPRATGRRRRRHKNWLVGWLLGKSSLPPPEFVRTTCIQSNPDEGSRPNFTTFFAAHFSSLQIFQQIFQRTYSHKVGDKNPASSNLSLLLPGSIKFIDIFIK